jgi:type II secretory pathway component GspD/PulD (secretin)
VGFVEEAKPEEAEPVPVVLEAERLIELIRATIDPQSWNENPDATINVQHGTLVVKQSREVHDQIRSLLSDLRASAGLLVSIEARFLMVADNFLEDVGIDFRGLGDDTGGVGVGGGGTNNPMDDLGNVGTPATPSGPGTGNDSGGFYLDNDNLDVRGRSENLFDQILGGGNLSNTGGLSLQYTFLDDTELEVILRAVEKDERIQTLNAPRLMVHDTQRAHLTVLNQVSYVRDFEVEVSQAATIADPVIDVIQDGVILDVLPIVSADRRFVTMELRPTVAQLDRPITQFSTSLGNGNPVILQLPTLRVQRVRTTVTVPDGGVLLLGGARFFTQQDLESGIPFLNKVPVASFLFNRKGRFEGRQQLLILLKSHIVVPDEEATLAASRVM